MLKRKLNLNLWQTKGVLESLWGFCAINTMQGDIGRFTNEEICTCIEWDDDSDGLFSALIECGWLDECAEHRLVVHDWEHHCPTYIRGNLARYGKAFAKQSTKQGAKQGTDPQLQSTTYPIQANPIQDYSASSDAAGTFLLSKKGRKLQGDKLQRFTAFWNAFAYKRGRAEAVDAWIDIEGLNTTLVQKICNAATIEASSRKATVEAKQIPKMAQGWLAGRRWEDEPQAVTTDCKPSKPPTKAQIAGTEPM